MTDTRKPDDEQAPSPEAQTARDPATGQALRDRSLTEGEDDEQSDGGVGSARDTADSKGERLR